MCGLCSSESRDKSFRFRIKLGARLSTYAKILQKSIRYWDIKTIKLFTYSRPWLSGVTQSFCNKIE